MTMLNTLADGTANSLEGRRYYGFAWVWRRLIAGLVDSLLVIGWGLLAVLSVAVAIAIAGLFNEAWLYQRYWWFHIYYFVFIGFPVACVAVVLRHVLVVFRVSSKGDTLGHRLFGLRIVDRNGEMIGRGRSLGRHILGSPLLSAYVLPMIVLYLFDALFNFKLADTLQAWVLWGLIVTAVLVMLNHVWMGFDAEGRGWHDWVAGTVVVRERMLYVKDFG